MTVDVARARDAPGRAPAIQRLAGVLHVDLDGRRARYICHRPGCPRPVEGRPVTAAQHGFAELRAFIAGVRDVHRGFHEENDR
ncbi:hypothetical protein ACH4JS_34960 [Streptomyces sp. NPDC017638]|uniref:hypothetical protein n=1 Tax=unclassified Streptomyces TaxID=2593676 RepID=UPI002966420C|nr:hypothetical protein [Streptomyces sp. SCL15-4]